MKASQTAYPATSNKNVPFAFSHLIPIGALARRVVRYGVIMSTIESPRQLAVRHLYAEKRLDLRQIAPRLDDVEVDGGIRPP